MKPNESDATETGSTNRRRFLAAMGAFGVAGLAGCGGDGDDATPTDTEGGNGNGTGDTETPTEEPTPTPTEEPTPTPQQCLLPAEPAPLISFSGVSDGTLNVSPNAETIAGTITNPYLFDITNGEVNIEVSGDSWEVTGATGNTFDTLESQSSQDVEWEVSIPSVAGEEFEITADVTYEACDGQETAEVQSTQAVFVDPYISTEWQDLAIAPEYYDDLEEDQEAPGQLPSERVNVELDLSDWADAMNFQIRFADYWTSDGWGALLETATVIADGETIYEVEADTEDELQYIVEDNGSQRWSNAVEDAEGEWRFADTNSYWVYQFDVPEGTSELLVNLEIANGFDIDGREGLER